nr:hypothetical protein [Tanacetum cinerariifolium]
MAKVGTYLDPPWSDLELYLSGDKFLSLQALSNLHYPFSGFMNYLWSRARATGAAPGIKSIWNSTWRTGGRPGSSSGKTSRNFLTTVSSQMTHLVASITLDSARSCVMQSAFLTQGTVSSIPTVLSWGGSIRPKGIRPSILPLTVIIVAVAIVVAIVLVVVAVIIGIIVLVGVPSIIKLSFVITGWVYAFHQDMASTVRGFLCLVFLLRLSVLAMVAACASSAAVSRGLVHFLGVTVCFIMISIFVMIDSSKESREVGMINLTENEDSNDKDGDDEKS